MTPASVLVWVRMGLCQPTSVCVCLHCGCTRGCVPPMLLCVPPMLLCVPSLADPISNSRSRALAAGIKDKKIKRSLKGWGRDWRRGSLPPITEKSESLGVWWHRDRHHQLCDTGCVWAQSSCPSCPRCCLGTWSCEVNTQRGQRSCRRAGLGGILGRNCCL